MKKNKGHNGPRKTPQGEWERQIRVNLSKKFAEVAHRNPADPSLKPLTDVLDKYNATMKNQYYAFSDYCAEAEAAGETDTTLYRWTKDTIEQKGKKEAYRTRFTIYADGGKEVYDKAIASALRKDLKPLMEAGFITKISNISADPKRNPQAPKRFHK